MALGGEIDEVARLEAEECFIIKTMQHVQGPNKKRRIDGDFKEKCFEALVNHRASSVGELNHSNDLGCSGAKQWSNSAAMRELAGQRLTWGVKPSVDFLVSDASRFGNPAEETVVYLFFHTGSCTGGPLVPKASSNLNFALVCNIF